MFSVLRCLDERISDYMTPFGTGRRDHKRLTGLIRRPQEAGQKFSHTRIMHLLCGMMCMQVVKNTHGLDDRLTPTVYTPGSHPSGE
jgi:hypothetical protein